MVENGALEEQIAVMRDIIRETMSGLNQDEALAAMLEQMVTRLGYRAAVLRLLDAERQELILGAAYGLSQEYLLKGPMQVAENEVDRRVVEEGETVTISDLGSEQAFMFREQAAREGLVSMMVVPLVIGDHVVGLLRVYQAAKHTFSGHEIAFVSAIAGIGAQIIRQTRMYSAFRNLARNLNSSLELKDVLGTLIIQAVEELNVRAGSIRLLGPKRETLHMAAAYGLSEEYLKKGPVKVAQSPVDRRVFEEGKPVVISDLQQEAAFQYTEEAHREGIRSVLVLPLQIDEVKVGVLRLYSGQVRQFSAEEINFALAVADLGAVAIENARLHEFLKQRLDALKADADGWYRFLAFS